MTRQELEEALEEILPGCSFDVDDNGQVIIFTNRTEDEDDGELIEMEEEIDEDAFLSKDGDFERLEDEDEEDDE